MNGTQPQATPPSVRLAQHGDNGDKQKGNPDAGLRSLDHYKRALPKWRYKVRQHALPFIRWETPYLARLQHALRTPALDSYFAITANLGTHTFFMVGLPICFWCGYPFLGKALVHMLALGVFWSGFVKDFFSLPRPLSPPLHRITMSGSVALEYGFPSTHSANAISVAVYGLMALHSDHNTLAPAVKLALEFSCYFYALSIVFGRLYCGMHGFTDVIIGSALGAVIGVFEMWYGGLGDEYMHSSTWLAPFLASVIIIVLVRIHPEPADDCPCFDDSVAFAGVVIGVEFGTWTYGRIPGDPWVTNSFADDGVHIAPLGLTVNFARIVLGVAIVFLWREIMKPFLLKTLPHLFRLIEGTGMSLPRRFFTPASEYKSVPTGDRMDTLFPQASDFPRMVQGIRHPTTRGRSVSIGPQSAADAYETLAYRQRQRRESMSRDPTLRNKSSIVDMQTKDEDQLKQAQASGAQMAPQQQHDGQLGPGEVLASPMENGNADAVEEHDDAREEKEVFSQVTRPRVRYDVEVVTKLVVYTGIGWLSAAMIPLFFELVGLGTNHLRTM